MNCIYCGGDTSVENSRHQKRRNGVWRRRQCKDCHTIFTTTEDLDLAGSIIVSTKNLSEPFSRDKLFLSIHDSLKHRKSALQDATELTDTVLAQVLTTITSARLDSSEIAKRCHQTLLKFDDAAATHYAAFHLN